MSLASPALATEDAKRLFREHIISNAYLCSWIAECDEDAYRVLSRVSAPFARFFVLGANAAGWRRELRRMFARPTKVKGTIYYYLGRGAYLHREDDEPAVVYKNGSKEWWYFNKRHRENDRPAVELVGYVKEWWICGERHRECDKPAIEWADGGKLWYRRSRQHRDNDKPAVELSDGTKEWWRDHKRHRDGDKPAAERANGTREWWRDGKPERDGGKPTVEHTPWWVKKNESAV